MIPLGLELSRFADDAARERRRAAVRAQWGVEPDAELVTLVARLVPIKRVDRFLRVARLLADRPKTRFVVVGDGELRKALAGSPDARHSRADWSGPAFGATCPTSALRAT